MTTPIIYPNPDNPDSNTLTCSSCRAPLTTNEFKKQYRYKEYKSAMNVYHCSWCGSICGISLKINDKE